MDGDLHYRLGRIDGRLEAIEQRLDEGGGRHEDFDDRLSRLELAEAKRGGVIAAIAAVSSIVAGVITHYVTRKL